MSHIFSSLFLKILLFILILSYLTGCSSDDESGGMMGPAVEEQLSKLENAEQIASFSVQELQLLALFAGYGDLQDEILYDVNVYRVTYHTDYLGDDIIASGLICLPEGQVKTAPIISVHHGTEYKNEDAPSVYKDGFTGFELFASLGYVTSIPDYIGYGVSSDILHPYYNFEHTSGAVTDMIFAAKELSTDHEIEFNDQLFLTGYSEGGYVTMATHKAIQQRPELELNVTASAAGAGGYYLPGIMETIFSTPNYPRPDYLAFILHAYHTTLQWESPLSEFFQEPYAGKIPGLFNGENGATEVMEQLTTDLNELFTPQFMADLKNNSDNLVLKSLKENSLIDWVPDAPMYLYHGDEDEVVPISDSDFAYETFNNNGADQIEFLVIEGADHSEGVIPMIESVIPFFQNFR